MTRTPEQVLSDATEWRDVARAAGAINAAVNALADILTAAHVAAIERVLTDGPLSAVETYGAAITEAMAQLLAFSAPVQAIVDAASARITTLRIETAQLRGWAR